MNSNPIKSPLPIRDGVSASRLYLPKGDWQYLIDFLLERFPHLSPDIIKVRLQKGDMVNEKGVAYTLNSPYLADTWLWYYREVEQEVEVPFKLTILYQDEYLVAVDKPHFLASIPGGRYLQQTALIRLRKMLGNDEISPLHRLDRDTAGVLLFCVNPAYRGMYQTLFQSRDIDKVYECVAPFCSSINFPLLRESDIEKSTTYFTMQERMARQTPLTQEEKHILLLSSKQKTIARLMGDKSLNSQTIIDVITHYQGMAHYRLIPLSGKKHQLRVHMNGLGLPILNDEFYPTLLPARAEDDFTQPLQLLARSITFIDPITQEKRYFESQQTLDWVKRYFNG
ncbi:pseudouridine synthase [Pelistega ratti]|uniref:pseudouridine synthase n=1 Tax=Pelistega ratti TaxID=2652177 RepID=UPI00135C2742|nr:pseudouridine synthase [Pelistega ratti]